MDRIILNQSNFKYPRIDMEHFSFSDIEKSLIVHSLNRLESMYMEKDRIIFSINKYKGVFNGSMKINELNIYAYAKSPFAIGLFYKLRESIQDEIVERNLGLENIQHIS